MREALLSIAQLAPADKKVKIYRVLSFLALYKANLEKAMKNGESLAKYGSWLLVVCMGWVTLIVSNLDSVIKYVDSKGLIIFLFCIGVSFFFGFCAKLISLQYGFKKNSFVLFFDSEELSNCILLSKETSDENEIVEAFDEMIDAFIDDFKDGVKSPIMSKPDEIYRNQRWCFIVQSTMLLVAFQSIITNINLP